MLDRHKLASSQAMTLQIFKPTGGSLSIHGVLYRAQKMSKVILKICNDLEVILIILQRVKPLWFLGTALNIAKLVCRFYCFTVPLYICLRHHTEQEVSQYKSTIYLKIQQSRHFNQSVMYRNKVKLLVSHSYTIKLCCLLWLIRDEGHCVPLFR